jgi:signal transduction histidine kinase
LLYLIEQGPGVPSDIGEYARLAQEEVARISQITRQLLSFNREALQPAPVDLTGIIENVIGLFGPKLASAGVTVRTDYETREKVFGLPGELRQVFSNLIGNAVEATPKGGQIQVRVMRGTDWLDLSRRGVRVIIADNGSGIPRSARAGLFTPFFTTKGEKGTGLGLWVSKGIVEKHEGSMRFRSLTNGTRRGTTFSVFLPLQPSAGEWTGTAA